MSFTRSSKVALNNLNVELTGTEGVSVQLDTTRLDKKTLQSREKLQMARANQENTGRLRRNQVHIDKKNSRKYTSVAKSPRQQQPHRDWKQVSNEQLCTFDKRRRQCDFDRKKCFEHACVFASLFKNKMFHFLKKWPGFPVKNPVKQKLNWPNFWPRK